MIGTLAIVVSLLCLIYFAYRGWTVLLFAPLMAALAVILSGDSAYLLPAYSDTFMKALSGYVLRFFPIFLLGALFGRLMADSGAAISIANAVTKTLGERHAILVVVLVCAILTYGGVSLFVVAFAVYPIARTLFIQANLPKRLIPATIALGACTFTMTALPGTPAIQNAIPIPYYQTNAFAAPILGSIGAFVMFGLGLFWLKYQEKKARANNEGYGNHQEQEMLSTTKAPMSFGLAIFPIVLVIVVNALMTYVVFERMDFSLIAQRYPQLTVESAKGLWSIITALVIGCIFLVLINLGRIGQLKDSVNQGILSSMLPIFNSASEVGYGAVIASLSGFTLIREAVLSLSPDNPLISQALVMSVLAAITGSSSGSLSIVLETLGQDYLSLASQAGLSPELLHRVAVMASGGFDTLPHCGAIITLLSICHLTHRQAYGNIAVVTIIVPLVATAVVVTLGTLFGSF